MSNIAIIFAGGSGKRMKSKKPKQFLELHGKPILIYTLEKYNSHLEIDGIILVTLNDWISYCEDLIRKYSLNKVKAVIAGGETAFQSQRNGLIKAAELFDLDSIVLIHDGVRPLISESTISDNIKLVKKHGNSITVNSATETITVMAETGIIDRIIERSKVKIAKAPQSFYLRDILEAHSRAEKDGLNFVDSASMMKYYGSNLYTVDGPLENLKITTPIDLHTFRALVDDGDNPQNLEI